MKYLIVSMFTWLGVCLWLAAAFIAGGAAMGIFATLPDLQPSLSEYQALSQADQGRLAAGLITEPIFTATDIAQVILSSLAMLGVLFHWLLGMGVHRRLARVAWTITLTLATGLLWGRIVLVMPTMNSDLRLYRKAAAAGDLEAAAHAREAFDTLHPVASTMMETNAILLLIAVVAGAILSVPTMTQRTP